MRTPFLYLIGNRRAILDLAADRRAVWVGLLFVLSAGLAREYDGEDLLREPWHVVVPVGASLAASLVLFLVAFWPVYTRKGVPFLSAYRSFLTLFWMTAPLAWLYGIPYERFLPPADATRANLWTLGLVAAWRVALMVRVVSVLTGRSVWASLFLVMAFADAVALIAIHQMPMPVVSFMGGVRLTESEAIVQGVTVTVCVLGYLTAPLWGIGALVALAVGRPVWNVPAAPAGPPPADRALWLLAALSVLVWLPPMAYTQAEQHRRTRVERDMREGRVAEALEFISAHELSDFPPGWEPPPRIGYGEETPRVLDVLELIVTRDVAPWVRAEYANKLRRYLTAGSPQSEQPARLTRILHALPEGPGIAAEHRSSFESQLSRDSLSAENRVALEALLKLAEKGAPR
jgi:hypothetical protein